MNSELLLKVIFDMEQNGILLNIQKLQELSDKFEPNKFGIKMSEVSTNVQYTDGLGYQYLEL